MIDKNTLCGCLDCQQAIDRAFECIETLTREDKCCLAQIAVAASMLDILTHSVDDDLRKKDPAAFALSELLGMYPGEAAIAHIAPILHNAFRQQMEYNNGRIEMVRHMYKETREAAKSKQG